MLACAGSGPTKRGNSSGNLGGSSRSIAYEGNLRRVVAPGGRRTFRRFRRVERVLPQNQRGSLSCSLCSLKTLLFASPGPSVRCRLAMPSTRSNSPTRTMASHDDMNRKNSIVSTSSAQPSCEHAPVAQLPPQQKPEDGGLKQDPALILRGSRSRLFSVAFLRASGTQLWSWRDL